MQPNYSRRRMNLLSLALICFTSLSPQSLYRPIDSVNRIIAKQSAKEQIYTYAHLSILMRNNDADTAMYFARKATDMAAEINNPDAKATALVALARAMNTKGNYELAAKTYMLGMEAAGKASNDSLVALALSGIGTAYWQLGRHAESLEHLFRSLQIREKLGDKKGIIASKSNIGMVYQTQAKLGLAERYISESLALMTDDSDPSNRISTLHTLANIYGMQGKIKEAFAIDEEGIRIAERTNNTFAKAVFYDNMGNCYFYSEPPDYRNAFLYFNKALAIDSAFGNRKQMSDSYLNLGMVMKAQKRWQEAIGYYLRSISLAEESGYAQGKLKALQSLADAYRSSGNGDQAFAVLQQSLSVKDSLVNTASESRIAELQTLYETEKKQQQINLQQAELSRKNVILAAIIILAVLLGLLGISAYLRFRLKQKTRIQTEIMKQQELATRAVIEAEENERQRIARDLHDGIGQMMSAAKMNLSAYESSTAPMNEHAASLGKIISLVDESCREIRNVSHNMMPNALLKKNLATALQDFIDKIDTRSLAIHLYTEGLENRMDSAVETVLYRVIQECVNNVIKHAKATTLDISVTRDDEGISATIEDNGKGFDAADHEKFDGIGVRNIITRVEYLKGTIEFDSAPGRGTLIAIHVPLNK